MEICFLILIVAMTREAFTRVENPRNIPWKYDDPRWETKIPNWWDEATFVSPEGPLEEKSKDLWIEHGQKLLKSKGKLNLNTAKNLVIFIGDGMSLSTQMAARAYLNDVRSELSFEKFPASGLSKVYCINYQVPDSACTATAMLSGVKNNYGTLGLTGGVNLRNCTGQRDNSTHVDSIFKFAQDAGKSTGFVTTTRITHATPAAAYAHSSSRFWESNENTPEGCDDIALQLVHGEIGSRLDVALGGGRRHFLPVSVGNGWRTDERDLIDEYRKMHREKGKRAVYVENRQQLMNVDSTDTDKLLGIFSPSHLQYSLLANADIQPSLKEMTAKALEIVKKNDYGFVLLVEGGRIDTGHHETRARLALEETLDFADAVDFVRKETNEDDTLIVVTADHSHVFTVGGYAPRDRSILGVGDFARPDWMWFYTLNYANGPGHTDHNYESGRRRNPRGQNPMDPQFRQPTTLFKDEETHSGEDVGVYASGPFSHMFTGVYEQSYIAHAMMYATCLGPEEFMKSPKCVDSATNFKPFKYFTFVTTVLVVLINSLCHLFHE